MRRAFCTNFDSLRMYNNMVFCMVKFMEGGDFWKWKKRKKYTDRDMALKNGVGALYLWP